MNELFHEIHTSERKGFRGCRLRWYWRYREWRQPITPIKPLEFGIAFHKGMEVLYDPELWNKDRQVVTELAVKAFEDTCEEQRAKYEAESRQGYLDNDAETDYAERVTLGKGMLRHYAKSTLEQDQVEGLTPVKVEVSFSVPVTNPVTNEQMFCKCQICHKRFRATFVQDSNVYDAIGWEKWQGLPVVYKGRIDCLMKDTHGDYWVYDWKTCGRFMQDDTWLFLDDQIASYCWALIQVLGLPIRGFIYHEQLKAFPEPPKENKTTRKGCKFSVSKQQATDYQTFVTHVAKYDTTAYAGGYYDEYLEWLQSDEGAVFSKRHKVSKTLEELQDVHENIWLEAQDITNPNLNIYPNAGMFNCNWCAYKQPCIGKRRRDDYQYTLDTLFITEAPYYLQPSTDSRGNQ